MAFLNVSRNAYDDVFQRNLEIRKTYKTDSILDIELTKLQANLEKNPSYSTMSNRIFEIQEQLNRLGEIQNQIPSYLIWTKDIIAKYKSYKPVYDQIKAIEEVIDLFLNDFSKSFDTITGIPFLVKKELFMPSDI